MLINDVSLHVLCILVCILLSSLISAFIPIHVHGVVCPFVLELVASSSPIEGSGTLQINVPSILDDLKDPLDRILVIFQ